MAYEIPQQLEYKEKIMFNLTFKQLAYAFIFGLLAILCIKKSPNQYLGFCLALFPSITAIAFMFFDLETKLKNYKSFLKYRKLFKNDPKLIKFFDIKDLDYVITDGPVSEERLMILKDLGVKVL